MGAVGSVLSGVGSAMGANRQAALDTEQAFEDYRRDAQDRSIDANEEQRAAAKDALRALLFGNRIADRAASEGHANPATEHVAQMMQDPEYRARLQSRLNYEYDPLSFRGTQMSAEREAEIRKKSKASFFENLLNIAGGIV